jgi:hypothetical protein
LTIAAKFAANSFFTRQRVPSVGHNEADNTINIDRADLHLNIIADPHYWGRQSEKIKHFLLKSMNVADGDAHQLSVHTAQAHGQKNGTCRLLSLSASQVFLIVNLGEDYRSESAL